MRNPREEEISFAKHTRKVFEKWHNRSQSLTDGIRWEKGHITDTTA